MSNIKDVCWFSIRFVCLHVFSLVSYYTKSISGNVHIRTAKLEFDD